MTKKKIGKELDAFACIQHAAELGQPFEEYMESVTDFGRKRIRMIQKGLRE